MLRGFNTAASGMIANQRMQETLSNNIANSDTPGYKADQGTMRAFPELLLQQMGGETIPTSNGGLTLPTQKELGSLNTGVYMQEAVPDFSQGDLRETGNTTDLALLNGNLPDDEGFLFFNVQNADGDVRQTRNGNFTVDGEGFLTTNQGYYVLDNDGGPIQTDGMEFIVQENGTLEIGDQNVQLGLTYSSNAADMVKEGDDLYTSGDEADPVENARDVDGVNFEVRQRHVEGSNVDPSRTMTEMMNTYRTFEMNQRALKAYDQSMQKTVNDVGKLG
ncbi:flagellar hook-basal body complex protein FlhO [Halobacillus andaensis]|uniref:Flagellar hook-basal body complex protein FlhO n=1 Tax=Halobacillus andaensis TaxID=1176239 RepID=A0A917B430_HALAA|nr:flagellar hook-basal body protein [Halobacillus andaensis]MBP2004389.1 flagellar basal-body rod protein FlgG [Halobacillus andaensis]GGF21997.1 flagellar hook-basal body complex protein FlhO [Halobacillus andaensis]